MRKWSDLLARGDRADCPRFNAKGEFPWDTVKRMADLGLLGVPWPEELGGAGLDVLTYVTVIDERPKVHASHAITVLGPHDAGHVSQS